jgi:hypothetical protein
LKKRLNVSNRNNPLHREPAAQNADEDVSEIKHKSENGLYNVGHIFGFPSGGADFFVGFVEFFFGVGLAVKGAHNIATAVCFFHDAAHFADCFLLISKINIRFF